MKNKSSEIEHGEIKEEPKKTTDADEDREEEDSQSPKALDFEHVEIKEELLNFEEDKEGSDDQNKNCLSASKRPTNYSNGTKQNTRLLPNTVKSYENYDRHLRNHKKSVHAAHRSRDEFTAFAKNVACSLRKIKDRKTLTLAKYKINNILFEAEMGMLRHKIDISSLTRNNHIDSSLARTNSLNTSPRLSKSECKNLGR